ncbi:Cysteine and glycine-rich protein 2-like protein [Dinothrombium tinctorium]|uniref:Cysteine and glycine-rich protein 2-like protein n=1 Tax=Dinothrombium tinctorium TaxID=1965070 RepID=A0A3S3SJL5_9ACAR|nr:Cysteine and glycine-rich protein 2-like protein [Dinothrombium tinctorium]
MPGNCARCEKTVYFNEEKLAIGKLFHVKCFVCANESCKRRLDSNNLTEHSGEIYCKSCYGKLFGPRGYGYGVGAGVLSMDTGDGYKNGPPTSNIPATAQAFVAPKSPSTPPVKNGTATANGNKPKFGGADICPRCGKAVYMAEKMMGGGSSWHKITCFCCKECNKRLESTTLCEREGEIYCKTCYARNWGPKGYGFGGGGQGVMQTS